MHLSKESCNVSNPSNQRANALIRFLKRVLPYFSFYQLDPKESDIEKYLKINNDLRKENHDTLLKLSEKTSPEGLWEGPWLRLKNAATMARFAYRREYYIIKERRSMKRSILELTWHLW